MRRLFLCAVLSACATEYSRRQAPGDDPAEPAAPASAVRAVELYETPAIDAGAPNTGHFSCPMHPEVHQPAPGRCPICGMNLERRGPPP
jgi:hypothetical protein